MKLRQFAILGLLIAIIWGAGWPLVASAHTLEADGAIKALLHINPDDEPTAGQKTGLWFSLTDSEHKFTAAACDCRLVIKDGDRTLMDRPITAQEAPRTSMLEVVYTFPRPVVYDITLQSKPRQAGEFQPFSLAYDVRVGRGAAPSTSPVVMAAAIGFAVTALTIVSLLVYQRRR
ncbi:MAG TPA: hypothetical protein VLI05_06420 [Candidatus Saccharimonadia bacterium]|nr:hypothetical protein [Candidatus Saccharimonadia bacterium]